MGDTIVIETPVATVLEVSGKQGPQGVPGPKGDPGDIAGEIAWANITGKPATFAPSSHTHPINDVTGLQTALDGKQASGNYATLVSGKVPSDQLPSFVDDVVEYANLAAFPVTGESGKIYVAIDTRKTYRWSGSAYVEISPSEVTSVNGATGAVTVTVPSASSTTPAALGTSAVGSASTFARADHVHAMPSAADVGAAAATHASTHHTGGADAIAPNQISAQWAQIVSTQNITADTVLTAGRNRFIRVGSTSPTTANITLPFSDNQAGDIMTLVGINVGPPFANTYTIRVAGAFSGGVPVGYTTLATMTASGQSFTFVSDGTLTGWSLRSVDTHTHPSTQITGLGTAATQDSTAFAPATGIAPSAITGTAVVDSDARLSDTRTPTAHAASHAAGGSDPLAPSDIGAQSIFVTQTIISATTLTAQRARIYEVMNFGAAYTITMPSTNNIAGDVIVFRSVNVISNTVTISNPLGNSSTLTATNQQYRYIYSTVGGGSWQNVPVDTHTHAAADITSGTLTHERGGLEADVSAYNGLVKISGGSTSAVTVTSAGEALLDDADAAAQRTTLGLGTAATAATGDFAAASHSHGNITNDGKVGSDSGRVLVTTTAGAVTTLALGTANQVLRVNSGATGVEFADPAASGVTGAASSASDVLGVSGANITGVDANADRIVFWDDSASALKYLEAGSGLSISGTTMTVTATGGATNLWIPASAWIPRTTGGCGVDSREIGATNRANVDELLFDTGTEEFAQALVVMPSNYNNSTITARFYWTAASGSGGVAWGISGRAYGDDDALDQASGTRIVVTDTFITANDVHVTSATSAVTIDGTPAANKAINFQVSREVGNGSDTLAVDARLLGVEILFN